MCGEPGCDKPVNRDGVCLRHKLLTVSSNSEALRQERNGTDLTEGKGMATYVRDMYEKRRSAGLPDPEPATRAAAKWVPKMPVNNRKKYRENNGGM